MILTNFDSRTLLRVVFFLSGWCMASSSAAFTTTKLSPMPLWNTTIVDKLRRDLLQNYDKFSRPAQPFNTTTVQFQFYLRHIDLNEMKSTMSVHCYVRLTLDDVGEFIERRKSKLDNYHLSLQPFAVMGGETVDIKFHIIFSDHKYKCISKYKVSSEWKDEKMQWNSSNYDGIKSIHLAEHEIWQPDISLYNSAASVSINSYGTAHMIAYEDGNIFWVPPTQFSVLCDLDFTYWPFDEQKCFLKFGSWTHHGDQIDLVERDKPEMSEMLINSTEWMITEVNQSRREDFYSCCTEPYPSINIHLTLKRISPSYKAIIVTPAFVIIVLTLLSFWLPPQAGEKVVLNACTAVIICLFLLFFTQKLPAMGTHTPLIVLFYSSCLYLASFSMIGSIVVISISRSRHSNCLPWVIKQPLTGKFGYFLGLSCYINQSSISASQRVTAEEMRDHQVTYFDDVSQGEDHHIMRSPSISVKPTIQQDWVLLAAAIDRILFILYFFLFSILALVYAI